MQTSAVSSPVVSVLMAVYNAEAYLEEALRSLLQQTLCEVEVLAVDDASTDRSLAILQRVAAEDARLRVFHQDTNQGQAVARNLALRYVRGDYVCMVDADDWLAPDALAQVVAVFRAHPQTDCVLFSLMMHHQEDGREELYRIPEFTSLTGEEAFRLSLDWTLHGLYVVRRDIHLRYPYDDSCRLYSDDNTTRLHYLHSREVRPSSGVYYYRKHAESSTTAISPKLFLYMDANLSMKRTLEAEGIAAEIRAEYETHRWHNYRWQLWLFFDSRRAFTEDVQQELLRTFGRIYRTFPGRWLPFSLHLVSERLRWRLRRTLARFLRRKHSTN